jgi:hypothetical protein
MSKRLRHKKKAPKGEGVPKVPPPKSPPTVPAASKRQAQIWTKLGIGIGLISLITLIELFPRLSASGSSPLDPNDQLSSSRFTVTNDGYVRLTDVMSACFLREVTEGNVHFRGSMARIVQPPENKLGADESFTVPCTTERMIKSTTPLTITQADLAIAVYYRPWPLTFLRGHKLLRLVARTGKQGEVVWDRQPAAPLEEDYDAFIRAHGGTFPPQLLKPTRPNFK